MKYFRAVSHIKMEWIPMFPNCQPPSSVTDTAVKWVDFRRRFRRALLLINLLTGIHTVTNFQVNGIKVLKLQILIILLINTLHT
jgi:hypothetical protein